VTRASHDDDRRPSVAVAHLAHFGHADIYAGGESVAVHTLGALQGTCNLTFVTDLVVSDDPAAWCERANAFFDTDLDPDQITFHALPMRPYRFARIPKIRGIERTIQRQRNHVRLRNGPLRPDVWVSTRSEFAVQGNGPVLQYVHFPARHFGLSHHVERVGQLLTNASLLLARQHRTYANSEWTANYCRELGFTDVHVMYPPVTTPETVTPWEERRNDLVTLGRVALDKRLELAIDVGAELIRRGVIEHHHLIGPLENESYARELRDKIQSVGMEGRIALRGPMPRDDLKAFLQTVRYGIHAMKDEHFGIAPAEMLAAGCLPLVHDSGGQVEVVNREPALIFQTVDEATRKLDRLVTDPEHAKEVLRRMDRVRTRFSVATFIDTMRREVNAALARTGAPSLVT